VALQILGKKGLGLSVYISRTVKSWKLKIGVNSFLITFSLLLEMVGVSNSNFMVDLSGMALLKVFH